jgi:2-keto-4-pentenoate hydratase/2-oxohepta-3-ene-1,7-dioic acid hydratase in catechol pathway
MKIICAGMNYLAHKEEMSDTPLPEEPVIFMKPDTATLKNNQAFFIPEFSSNVQYEAEIVVKINRLGKNIARKFAHRYYNEITVGIDMTARDLQQDFCKQGKPWECCKAFDNSAVIGEFINIDTLDVNNIDFHLDIDKKTVQRGNTGNMLFSVDDLIEYTSKFFTLRTGDLIFTGTPAGTGRVEIGNFLEGYIFDKKVLECRIK